MRGLAPQAFVARWDRPARRAWLGLCALARPRRAGRRASAEPPRHLL